MTQMTGKRSGTLQKMENSRTYPLTFEFDIIVHSEQSVLTMLSHLLLTERVPSYGERLVLEKRTKLLKKREGTFSLKLQLPNGGTDTKVRQTLLSMNFEEGYRSSTYSDGSIIIQSVWKLKGRQHLQELKNSGSPPIFTQEIGTQTSTTTPTKRSFDDSPVSLK